MRAGRENCLAESFRIQVRVVDALVRREFISMFGRQGVGFLMLFVEPLVIMLFVITAVAYSRLQTGAAFPVIPFVISGWGLMWVCRYPFMRLSGVVKMNASFFYHKNITVFDVILARTITQLTGVLVSFFLIFGTMYHMGMLGHIEDAFFIYLALFLTIWYSAAVCILIGTLGGFHAFADKLGVIVGVLHLFLTGAMFMVDWLPKSYQDIILWLPMVHATEMMRHGFYGSIIECHYDIAYIIRSNLLLTAIALAAINIYRNSPVYGRAE